MRVQRRIHGVLHDEYSDLIIIYIRERCSEILTSHKTRGQYGPWRSDLSLARQEQVRYNA